VVRTTQALAVGANDTVKLAMFVDTRVLPALVSQAANIERTSVWSLTPSTPPELRLVQTDST
jgi:hypothetical protein